MNSGSKVTVLKIIDEVILGKKVNIYCVVKYVFDRKIFCLKNGNRKVGGGAFSQNENVADFKIPMSQSCKNVNTNYWHEF